MIDFNEKLKTAVSKIDGLVTCIFSGLDGIGISSVIAEEKFESGVLDVELATMIRSLFKVVKSLKLQKVDEFVFKTGDLIIFIKMVGEEYFIGLILKNSANLGRARLEIRKIVPSFEKEVYSN